MNTNPGHRESNPPAGQAVAVTLVYRGQRHRVYRTADPAGVGTVKEYWPERGVIGSTRKWLGHKHTERLYWWAAVNPTATPYAATEAVEDLPSRRAALDWLFQHSPTTSTAVSAEVDDATSPDHRDDEEHQR
jgi:hypothetical protein